MRILVIFICSFFLPGATGQVQGSKVHPASNQPNQGYEQYRNCIILAEQSEPQIAIFNVITGEMVWNWKPAEQIKNPEHVPWFSNPSDAKVVYGGNYVLMTASGGACALIRIRDKKMMFYAKAGHNPHSAEILPDGNIVCAASTGHSLTVFITDTLSFPENVGQRTFHSPFSHNVVWDQKRNLLWTAEMDQIRSWKYNFNSDDPQLLPVDSLAFDDTEGHDLFPVPGEDALYLSTVRKMWIYHIAENRLEEIKTEFRGIKSISSRTKGELPVISVPKEEWWTDEIIGLDGSPVFHRKGLKIYKARWIVENPFSYPDFHIQDS
jgi:hypothetical protein